MRDDKQTVKPLKELFKYCLRYLPAIILSLILGGTGAVFSVIGPDKIADMVKVIEEGLGGNIDLQEIGRIGRFLTALYGLGWLFSYAQQFILTTVTQRISQSLRTEITEKINRMPLRYFDMTSFGDILSRLTNDVDTIGQMLGSGIGTLVSSVTLLTGALVMMFVTNALLAFSAILASLLGFALMILIAGQSQKYFLTQQQMLGKINGYIEEIFSGQQIIRAYNGEADAQSVFDEINAGLLQPAVAASTRVFEFLHEEELEDESDKTKCLQSVQGNVEFDHVRFGYRPEKSVIHNFSVNIRAGQKVAIVGHTGAGKTTIVNLLMRFYEVDGGEIRIDVIPIRQMKRENVRCLFCMVLQDTWIFEGTLRENLAYCKEGVTDAQLDQVCRAVGLTHYVKTLPNGYDTVLNEHISLSAGQRQLVTIARAMIEDAPLLILDEATSSVDTKTELAVQEAMDKLMDGRTSFIIAHRLSTIRSTDLILVMKDGDIVESGNHLELLSKNGVYAQLYNSQFEVESTATF